MWFFIKIIMNSWLSFFFIRKKEWRTEFQKFYHIYFFFEKKFFLFYIFEFILEREKEKMYTRIIILILRILIICMKLFDCCLLLLNYERLLQLATAFNCDGWLRIDALCETFYLILSYCSLAVAVNIVLILLLIVSNFWLICATATFVNIIIMFGYSIYLEENLTDLSLVSHFFTVFIVFQLLQLQMRLQNNDRDHDF